MKEPILGDADIERIAAAVLERLTAGALPDGLVSAVAAAVAERLEASAALPRPRAGECSPDQIGPYEVPLEMASVIWDGGPAAAGPKAEQSARFWGAPGEQAALQAELDSAMVGPRLSRPLRRPER